MYPFDSEPFPLYVKFGAGKSKVSDTRKVVGYDEDSSVRSFPWSRKTGEVHLS